MNQSVVLDVSNLSFGFSGKAALLHDFDLSLRQGERLALVGPNGAGKSTLLHLLMGFRKPYNGTVRWFGEEAASERDFTLVRRKVGLLFQNSDDQLFCPTVGEEIAFGPFNLGCPRSEVVTRVANTLSMFGLAGAQHKVTSHLSEGEKRLVCLAAIEAMAPAVLLLDEPTNGLDEHARTVVLDYLAESGKPMMIATHDHELINRLGAKKIAIQVSR